MPGRVDVESHRLQKFELLVELFVAEQEPLRKLHHCVETVNQIVHVVQHFLVLFYLGLLLHDPPRNQTLHPPCHTLELQVYVFLYHLALPQQLLLTLGERLEMLVGLLAGEVDLFVSESQVEALADDGCLWDW